jgi:HlyD family secretion protein
MVAMSQGKWTRVGLPLAALGVLVIGGLAVAGTNPQARTIQLPCRVLPYDQVELYAGVPGFLKEQKVDIGDRIKRGEVLAVVDAAILELDMKAAEAARQRAQARLNQADAALAAAQAVSEGKRGLVTQRQTALDSAQAAARYAQRQVERFTQLQEVQSIEIRILDEALERLRAAKAAVAAAEAALTIAKTEAVVNEANVNAARAARSVREASLNEATFHLEKAQYLIGMARTSAPFDGVVTRRNYFVGDFVLPRDKDGRQPLLTVQRTDKLRAVIDVPERHVPGIKVGDAVKLNFDALPGAQLKDLKISRISFDLNPGTRTMRAEIDIPNADGQLRPGMLGTAAIRLP